MDDDEIECERVDLAVFLLLGPSTAFYLQWVCGGLDALVRQSSTDDIGLVIEYSMTSSARALIRFSATLYGHFDGQR